MTTRVSTASLPSVQVEDFEGPLDLLLNEVRRQNVAIDQIAMAPVVARFLACVRTATERNLNLDIEWLHMAATLIQWKSRSLLMLKTIGEPASDPIRDSLIQQLRQRTLVATEDLISRGTLEQSRFSRASELFSDTVGPDEPEEASFVSVWDLINQARDISRWVLEHRESHRQYKEPFSVEKDDVTIAEMIKYFWTRLGTEEATLDATNLINEQSTAARKASLFLGILELVRDQQLQVEQEEIFGSIRVCQTLATTRSSDDAIS